MVPGQRAGADDLAAGTGRRILPQPNRSAPTVAGSAADGSLRAAASGGAWASAAEGEQVDEKEQRAGRRAVHRAVEDGAEVAEQAGPGEDASASSGRHTVPDELVQATTYRLPADRVFRAKVRETPGSPGLPDESTTRLVPKPRQS